MDSYHTAIIDQETVASRHFLMWKSFSLSETDDYTNVASPNHPIMASPTCHGVATVYRSSRKVVPSRNAVDDRSRSKYIVRLAAPGGVVAFHQISALEGGASRSLGSRRVALVGMGIGVMVDCISCSRADTDSGGTVRRAGRNEHDSTDFRTAHVLSVRAGGWMSV